MSSRRHHPGLHAGPLLLRRACALGLVLGVALGASGCGSARPSLPPPCAGRSEPAAILGAVASPGRVPAGTTLRDAIAHAGGITAIARSGETSITRRTCDGREVRVRTALSESGEVELTSGDVVVVPAGE